MYKIPKGHEVGQQINEFTFSLKDSLSIKLEVLNKSDLDKACLILAKIHYQFVRIHPFSDGNGRIARVLTNQVAILFKLTPVVTGFPRHDRVFQNEYHEMIKSCPTNRSYEKFTNWIRRYIEKAKGEI